MAWNLWRPHTTRSCRLNLSVEIPDDFALTALSRSSGIVGKLGGQMEEAGTFQSTVVMGAVQPWSSTFTPWSSC